MRPLALTSLYPPRRDVVPCAFDADPVCRSGTVRHCLDNPDAARFASAARQAMPDIDAVTIATPPADVEQTAAVLGPGHLGGRRLRRLARDQHRGRLQRQFNDAHLPDRRRADVGQLGDDLRLPVPRAALGRVQRPVRARGASRTSASTAVPAGYGSVDGTEANAGEMHTMDGDHHRRSGRRARQRRRPPQAGGSRTSGSRSRCETAGSTTRPRCRAASRPQSPPTPSTRTSGASSASRSATA